MSSQIDPKVQKAMELLKAKSKHFESEEEALKEAQAKPVIMTEELQNLFDDVVEDQTGCSRISFYIPTELIEKLVELENLGIEPNELVTTAIQSAIHTVDLSLSATRNLSVLPEDQNQ